MQKLGTVTNKFSDVQDGQNCHNIMRGLYDRFSSQIFNSAGLAIATTTTQVKTANTIYGVAGGVLFTKAATDNFWTLAGTVTNAKFNVFCLFIDSSGAATAAMGKEGASLAQVVFPPMQEAKTLVGFVIINPTGTGNFVGGTTPLGDATVVPNAVYVNTVGMFDPSATIK